MCKLGALEEMGGTISMNGLSAIRVKDSRRVRSKIVSRSLTIGLVMLVMLVMPSYARANEPDKSGAKSAQAKQHNDRKGSIQEGVQSLTNRLVTGMKKTDGAGYRRMAVLPFEVKDAEAKTHELGRVSSELLSSRLAQVPKVVQVERDRLDAVVKEIQRSEKGELSKDSAVSVGKLLGASNIVLGTVSSSGADYLITARIVDSESGRIVTAADQIFPKAGMVALSEDVVEVKSKTGAAIRSAVFPGWGQMYNGDTSRGLTYSATFVGLAAGAITSTVLASKAENSYNENTADTVDDRDVANGHYNRVNYFLIGLGALWAVAVADAYVTGADATTVNIDLVGGESSGMVNIKGSF